MLSQLIELLSQPPGNVIYHLITLFALQVVFAISFSHWRRNRHDSQAVRMAWAAGAIFLLRLGLMVAGLVQPLLTSTAVSILPPLEQALHTVTAVLLIWAIVPHPQNPDFQRVSQTILFTILGIIAIATIFFSQSWQAEGLNQMVYNESDQATVWGLLQIVLLGFGLLLVLANQAARTSLRSSIIGLLLLVHLAHFWNVPEIIPTQTDVPYLIRLGDLIIFPLWAVLAYQQTLIPLLSGRTGTQVNITRRALRLATHIIHQQEEVPALMRGLDMVAALVPARFVGLITSAADQPQRLYLVRRAAQSNSEAAMVAPQQWQLNRDDWPALRQVLETGQGLELQPGGSGARQLRLLYEELGIGDNGSLLVEPLPGDETVQGLLLLGRGQGYHQWPDSDAVLAQPVAAYLGQVLFRLRQLTALGERPLLPLPDSDLAPAGRLITLEEERNRLATELEVAQNRARQAERRAAEARKQAEDLAATVEAFEAIQPQTTPTQVKALEGELESLRESLMVAEEAMAMAAASEGGLSTEWIMMTITRYSGQLEEAQAQIQKLQQELDQRNREGSSQIVAALAQELRTPMTSISGYADLLLNGSAGLLGSRQRDFLQRVRANVERMDALINQLVQLTSGEQTGDSSESTVTTDLPAVMDTAVQSVLSQVREKKLQLDLDLKIDDWLPPIAVPHNVLQQILNHLLHNACRSSHQQTYVTLQVQAYELSDPAGHDKSTRFLHIAIRDSGDGIHVDDRARVFDPQYQADDPLIAGVGDTGAGLAMAHSLATAHGGRMWVDSQPGEGSTFSVLFPLGYRSGVEEVIDPHLLSRNGQEDG